jgi:hypothetical protein
MIETLFVETIVRNRCCPRDMLPKVEAALSMTMNIGYLVLRTKF